MWVVWCVLGRMHQDQDPAPYVEQLAAELVDQALGDVVLDEALGDVVLAALLARAARPPLPVDSSVGGIARPRSETA